MKIAYFLRGLPASGKTTWAKKKLAALNKDGKRRAVRVNKDEIRARLVAKGSASEGKVIKRETELVTKAMKSGLAVIIDNTHFNPIHEWRYRDLADEYGYRFQIVSFEKVSINECIRRDGKRRKCVGQDVIVRMFDYSCSLTRSAVAGKKKEWTAKRVAAAKRLAAKEKAVVKKAAVGKAAAKKMVAKANQNAKAIPAKRTAKSVVTDVYA